MLCVKRYSNLLSLQAGTSIQKCQWRINELNLLIYVVVVVNYFKADGVVTVSMDANFGLVRKHHSGKSPLPLSIANSFFLDSSDVDNFVTTYTNDKQKDQVSF